MLPLLTVFVTVGLCLQYRYRVLLAGAANHHLHI
jgi:hypothetical protein